MAVTTGCRFWFSETRRSTSTRNSAKRDAEGGPLNARRIWRRSRTERTLKLDGCEVLTSEVWTLESEGSLVGRKELPNEKEGTEVGSNSTANSDGSGVPASEVWVFGPDVWILESDGSLVGKSEAETREVGTVVGCMEVPVVNEGTEVGCMEVPVVNEGTVVGCMEVPVVNEGTEVGCMEVPVVNEGTEVGSETTTDESDGTLDGKSEAESREVGTEVGCIEVPTVNEGTEVGSKTTAKSDGSGVPKSEVTVSISDGIWVG